MQTTLELPWARRARCAGVFRYQWLALGRTYLAVMGVILLTQLISLMFPLFTDIAYHAVGVSADLGMTLTVMLVCSFFATGRNARFFFRFGTPRLSVWLCTLLSLVALAAAMLIGTLAVSLLTNAVTGWAQGAAPGRYDFAYLPILEGREYFHSSIGAAFANLPRCLLYAAEWTCLFYLLAACFRRSKGWTLAVIFGVPALLCILLLIPAVHETVNAAQSASQSEMMVLLLKWTQAFSRIADFITHQWQWIQLGAAVVSLPLSYWCMRSTAQP